MADLSPAELLERWHARLESMTEEELNAALDLCTKTHYLTLEEKAFRMGLSLPKIQITILDGADVPNDR